MSASDPVFQAYLHAADPEADAALARIVDTVTLPIREACAAALGGGHLEVEDACADALMNVVTRVRQLREGGEAGGGIQNLAAYAAVTARRVCADYLRRAHPVSARFSSRVRYLLTRDPHLRLRRAGAGASYAGLAAWPDSLPSVAAADVSRLAAELRMPTDGTALIGSVRAVLEHAGGWVDVGALISALFDGASLQDPVFTATEDVDLPAPPVDIDAGDDWRVRLERAWSEIVVLPARQRAALLLNLRDEGGGSGLARLVLAGIATLATLAEALELAPAALAELWPSLPLDDARIAQRLGVTRQQVINLRKSARARLARRMTGSSSPVVIRGTFGRHISREQL